MAIIWFDTVVRPDPMLEPLNRAGYLTGKNYPVNRFFDHLAFSYRTGTPDMEFDISFRGRRKIIRENHCMLTLPGESWYTVPLKPCNELYFVFEHPERLFGGKQPVRDDFGLCIPPADSPFYDYAEIFIKLLTHPVTPALCSQLDCLAHAMLSCTFYGERINAGISPIEQIEGYINNHYFDDLDFAAIAARFGMSFSSFRRQWQLLHDLPPGATVLELRNRHARELLLNRQLTIGEIAVQIGYPDCRYFSRFFRKMNGLTPSEFRNRYAPDPTRWETWENSLKRDNSVLN